MYLPDRFRVDDPVVLREFIRTHDFATLITSRDGRFLVSHAPLLLDEGDGPPATLRGHLALANPMAAHFDDAPPVLALFMGPHAYIPRAWYPDRPTVPTWNYAAVYVEGTARSLHDPAALANLLDRTTRAHEGADGWRFDAEAEPMRRLMAGVRAFEISIQRVSGKFKLEQSGTPGDREAIARGLEASGDSAQAELARLMRAARRPPH